MFISTKSYYALRALSCLAEKKGVLAVKTIARQEFLPYDYLEKIFQKLKKAGFVKSAKGAEGGYFLARPAKNIKIDEIIKVLENRFISVPCLTGLDNCARGRKCSAKTFWQKLDSALHRTMSSISLSELAK